MQLEQSLAEVRRAGDQTAEAYALTDLAAVHVGLGCLTEAAGHLRAALLLHRRIGERASEADPLSNLGAYGTSSTSALRLYLPYRKVCAKL